jgi:hypothetical protein
MMLRIKIKDKNTILTKRLIPEVNFLIPFKPFSEFLTLSKGKKAG